MDFISILILSSIAIFAIFLTVGPILENRGKYILEESKVPPKYTNRIGMKIMILGLLIFFGGLISRAFSDSRIISIIVPCGYITWYIGGFIAVFRNESIDFKNI